MNLSSWRKESFTEESLDSLSASDKKGTPKKLKISKGRNVKKHNLTFWETNNHYNTIKVSFIDNPSSTKKLGTCTNEDMHSTLPHLPKLPTFGSCKKSIFSMSQEEMFDLLMLKVKEKLREHMSATSNVVTLKNSSTQVQVLAKSWDEHKEHIKSGLIKAISALDVYKEFKKIISQNHEENVTSVDAKFVSVVYIIRVGS